MAKIPKEVGGAGTQSPVGRANPKQDLSSLRPKERIVWLERMLEVTREKAFT